MTRPIRKISRVLRLRLRRSHYVWSAAIGVVLAVGYNAALPLLVSTTGVRAAMERTLDGWSGGKSRIKGEPEIRFWPEPLLILPSATIESTGSEPRPLAEIGRISASFSPLSALIGEPALEEISLVDPVITIERQADGTINWQRPHWLTPPEAAASAQASAFGDIAIVNGRLRVLDRMAGGNDVDIPGISGTIKWPSFAERLSAQLSARFGGEELAWAFVCEDPLTLFARRNAFLKTSITSAPLTFSFEGVGNLSSVPFASGHLQMSATSLATLVEWYQGTSAATLPPGGISIDTRVTTGEKTLKLDDLAFTMGGASATGVLDIALQDGKAPTLEGTLAFDRIDLNGVPVSALTPLGRDDRLWRLVEAFVGAWHTDVRLSSQEVLAGPLHLTDVAAGVMIDGRRASLDIGDSNYANGSLSGRVVLSEEGLEHGGRLQARLKDADFAAVLSGFGIRGPVPDGRGILSIDIGTDRAVWAAGLGDFSGNLAFSLANGSIAGFDAHAFADLVRKGEFFSLSQANEASFDFKVANVKASFADGTARLDRADFAGTSGNLSVAGVVPYRNGSLALAGTLQAETPGGNQPVRFFVGGSWPNPVISPLSVLVAPK
ncbi:cell envelope biogenesis protein AsmA [Sinorhizobium glycinis]|uniref:Cell envelope biogenesis protein AsmA n=1 Tax=Sinorhizobium glycinis TaxID=1472378 RepID=A0A178Y0Y6_9HYPH|nr:AsmA family protein [Sinorhizobium glycinis]OAP41014.1 cell envelope biogenesis protein AsmA [Sinorhizobium glycinis]